MATRVIAVEPLRRGFSHNFRVTLINVDPARRNQRDMVYVDVAEIYNYHRFQIACLKQLGRLCRFPLEKQARSHHHLQMLWNEQLGDAAVDQEFGADKAERPGKADRRQAGEDEAHRQIRRVLVQPLMIDEREPAAA